MLISKKTNLQINPTTEKRKQNLCGVACEDYSQKLSSHSKMEKGKKNENVWNQNGN